MGRNAEDIAFSLARLSVMVTCFAYREKRFQRAITFLISLFIFVAPALISEFLTIAATIISLITHVFFGIIAAVTDYVFLSIFYYTIPSNHNSAKQQRPVTVALLDSLFISIFANLTAFLVAGIQHNKVVTPGNSPNSPSPVLNVPATTPTQQLAELTKIAPKSFPSTPVYHWSGALFSSSTTTTLNCPLNHSPSRPLCINSVPLSLAFIRQDASSSRTRPETLTQSVSTTSRTSLQPPTLLLIEPVPLPSQTVLGPCASHLNQPPGAPTSIAMPQGPTVRDPAVAPKATRPARKKCAVKAVPLPRVKVVMRRAVPASKSDGYSNKKVILNVPASKSDGPTNKRAILKAPSGYKPTDVGQNLDTDIGESLNTDVEDHSSKESPNMDVGEVYDGPEPMDLDEEYDGPEPMDVDEEEGDGREPIDVNDGREAMDIDSWVDPDEDVDMLDVRNIGSAFNTTITTNTAVTFSALFQPTPTFLTSTVLRAGPAPTPWRSHSLPYARSSRANVFESLKTTQQHKTTSPYVRSAAKPSLAGPIVPLVTPSARALPLKRTAGSAGLAINTRKKPLRR